MRLSEFEIETIKELAEKHFGEGTTVYLFGSRTDENKKGGDIDLFITIKDEKRLNIEAKVQFLAELKTKIGDRKIDDSRSSKIVKNFQFAQICKNYRRNGTN